MNSHISNRWPALTSREEFAFLTDLVLTHSRGDSVLIWLQDQRSGTVRFANNQIIQNVDAHTVELMVTIGIGKKHGTAGTSNLTAGALRETVQRAESLARAVPEDPEFLPPPGRQQYEQWPTFRPETMEADVSDRLQLAGQAIGQCQRNRVTGAGIVSSSVVHAGVAANTGLFAFELRTEASFSLTAQLDDASGWTASLHRSIDHLDVDNRSLLAIENCRRGKNPQEIAAGRHTVILQPPAVAGLLHGMCRAFNAKSYETRTSPFSGKLHHRVIDPRFSLYNCPDHPDMLGEGFTRDGLPVSRGTWIEKGYLPQLAYDRYTARQKEIAMIPSLESLCLEGEPEDQTALEELIKNTERGILVTNFLYIRPVNAMDLTLTGMTRDGTFLIEDGKVTTSLRNFRFHDSLIRALNNIGGYTEPQEAYVMEGGKMRVPALAVHNFHFSSISAW